MRVGEVRVDGPQAIMGHGSWIMGHGHVWIRNTRKAASQHAVGWKADLTTQMCENAKVHVSRTNVHSKSACHSHMFTLCVFCDPFAIVRGFTIPLFFLNHRGSWGPLWPQLADRPVGVRRDDAAARERPRPPRAQTAE